jgi:phospholipid-binding lipoprotein MlaA
MKSMGVFVLDTPKDGRFLIRIWAIVLTLALLGGCAASSNPRDPLEPFNRAIYSFNDGFDRAIAKPVAEGYRSVIPELVRTGVSNFFSNLGDLWIAANNLLQGKVNDAANDFGRVVINTSIGLFGLIDVASDAGLEKHNEDFGQTLGRWGLASGPYVVLPFLGPSTFRDALSYGLVDTQADFVVQSSHVPTRNTLFFVRGVDTRANLLDASRVLEEAALDKYNFTRDAYLQRRQSLIYDGNPPREKEAGLGLIPMVEAEHSSVEKSTADVIYPEMSVPSTVASRPVGRQSN